MKKNQIIIIIVAVVLIFGGFIGWIFIHKGKTTPQTVNQEQAQEVLSFSGTVSGVDVENSFLMVKPLDQEKEFKVIVSDTTKLIKLGFPPNFNKLPKGSSFTPTQTGIEISGFKVEDNVFVKTKTDITGRSELNDVDFIQILL